jgi:hypothetical protein
MMEALYEFIEQVKGRPYKKNPFQLFKALAKSNAHDHQGSIFCSQLVAAAYQVPFRFSSCFVLLSLFVLFRSFSVLADGEAAGGVRADDGSAVDGRAGQQLPAGGPGVAEAAQGLAGRPHGRPPTPKAQAAQKATSLTRRRTSIKHCFSIEKETRSQAGAVMKWSGQS